MNLHYTDTGGTATALVFLHYFGGSGKTWQPVIEKLQDDYRCIAIDMMGFGESPVPKTEPSVAENRDDVLAVLTLLQLTQFYLIGHSMGGKIALAVAATQPNGLKALVLLAPSPPTPEPMTQDDRRKLDEVWGKKDKIEAHINRITANPLPAAYFEQTVADNLSAHASAWLGWLDKGSLEDISDEMSRIQLPLTVVSGSKDEGLSTAFLKEEFIKYFPDTSFKEVKNSGHLLPLEQPEEVAAIIRQTIIK